MEKPFSEEFKSLREQIGSQKDVAEMLMLSSQQIRNYEAGRQEPKPWRKKIILDSLRTIIKGKSN